MELLSMGELAGNSVQRSVEALVQHDDAKAQGVIDDDDRIDELYLKIDSESCPSGPAVTRRRRPSADLGDHAFSNLHLERVGDQAVNVAKLYLRTKDDVRQRIDAPADRGDGHARRPMIRTAMEAFGRRDLELALKVPTMDDPVDRLNRPRTWKRSSSRTTLEASTGDCT